MDIGKVFDNLGYVLLYSVLALLGALILVGALVYFCKREKFGDFKKYAFGIVVGFAIVAIISMSYIKGLDTQFETGGKKMLFWPVMAEIIVVCVGALAMLVCSLFSKQAFKVAGICTGVGALGGFIAIMVQMSKYYETVKNFYSESSVGLIVSAIVLILVLIALYILGDKRQISDTRSVVYGAISIALAFALSYVKFFEMPQGGSVTLASLLPLMIYSMMFGTRRGIIVCLIYGALQALQDPWIIHPMQFMLDYPLAFGMIGVSGIFAEKNVFKFKGGKLVAFIAGGIVAVCLRYASHVLSGVYAFADLTEYKSYTAAAAYSLSYNSFTFIDLIIDLVAGTMLFASNAFVTQMEKSSDTAKSQNTGVILNDDDDLDLLMANADACETCAHSEDTNEVCDACKVCESSGETNEVCDACVEGTNETEPQ